MKKLKEKKKPDQQEEEKMEGVEASPKALQVTPQDSTLMMDEAQVHVDTEMKDE